jgi:hypothetical protein
VLIPCLWHTVVDLVWVSLFGELEEGGPSFLLPWGPNILLAALVIVTEESGPYLCINILFMFMCIIWWMCQCWNFTHMCKPHAWPNHSLRGKEWANKTNLAPLLFVIFRVDFVTVSTLWYICFLILSFVFIYCCLFYWNIHFIVYYVHCIKCLQPLLGKIVFNKCEVVAMIIDVWKSGEVKLVL